MIFRKNVKKGGGHFRSEKFHCKFGAGATGLSWISEKCNIFSEKRQGWGSTAVFKNAFLLEKRGFPMLSSQGHSKLSTSFVLKVYRLTKPLRAFFSINPLFFHWSKAKEMEMEEGSARVSWYERLLLIGPNHFFHRLLIKGRESSER